jgi:hypothetical protein
MDWTAFAGDLSGMARAELHDAEKVSKTVLNRQKAAFLRVGHEV